MKDITKLTREETLDILCAPVPADEPEESDFIGESDPDEKAEETFVENWIERELN